MSAVVSEHLPVLRPMRQDDIPAVLAVEDAAYDFPWSETILRDCLRVGYYCMVCEVDGEIRGHGIMSLGVGECHLLNICIHPDFQRRGLGTVMINALLDLARWKKTRVAFLEVRVSNQGACRLYRHLGFSEIGRRKAYYPSRDGREDAIILMMELEPATGK